MEKLNDYFLVVRLYYFIYYILFINMYFTRVVL